MGKKKDQKQITNLDTNIFNNEKTFIGSFFIPLPLPELLEVALAI